MITADESLPTEVAALLMSADALASSGRALEALELLRAEGTPLEHPVIESRLVELRHDAFGELREVGFDVWPAPASAIDRSGPPRVPEVNPEELTADLVRSRILSHGSVLVRGLFTEHVQQFVDGIDNAFAHRDVVGGDDSDSWSHALKLARSEAQSLGRYWVSAAGGILACDSPKLLDLLFRAYEQLGLRELVGEYLGERPVLSANKCTLRRVPLDANADWHQDGAFLGDGIRALNVWVALSDCGVDAPGMDLVPKRFDAVVETGTGGAIFDWAVGPDTVARLAPDAPPVRPVFRAGDALLFDDLYLHRTAIDKTMTRPRYAIESWFFAASTYPDGQVPLVW